MHDSMSNLKELQPEVKTKLASQGIRTIFTGRFVDERAPYGGS